MIPVPQPPAPASAAAAAGRPHGWRLLAGHPATGRPVVPRSGLAGAVAMLPALDAPGAASRAIPRFVGRPPLARSPLRRGFVALLAAGLVVAASVIAVVGARMVLARFVDARALTGNTFATGTWAPPWYLHNNPTPPAGNTTSQLDLPLDVTAPTATTLYNYDTNCNPAKVGRDLELTSAGVGTTTVCRYATWLAAPVATARTLSGTATLSIWSAIRNFQSGQTGNLTAYLRDYDPAAGTYTLIGTATLTQANWQGGVGTWVQKTLTWSGLSYTLAAGRRLELKVVATTAASRNMWIAYDTTAYPSALTLP